MIRSKEHISLFIALTLLVLYSVVTSFTTSICVENSLYRTIGIAVVAFLLPGLQYLCKRYIDITKIGIGISIIAILLFVCSIPFYMAFVSIPSYVELTDLSQFRNLYAPLGILSNDWVGIQLLLTTFSLVALNRCKNPEDKTKEWIHLIAVRLEILSIVMTMSRLGLICVGLLLFALGLLAYKRILKIHNYVIICSAAVLALILLAFLTPEGVISTIIQSDSHLESVNGRVRQLGLAEKMTMRQLLFGIGLDNFALFNYANSEFSLVSSFTGKANFGLLKILVECGICGLLIYASLLAVIIHSLIKGWRRSELDERNSIIVLSIILFLILLKECSFSSITHSSYHLFLFLLPYVVNVHKTNEDSDYKKSIIGISSVNIVCIIICLVCSQIDNFSFGKNVQSAYVSASPLKISFSDMKVERKINDVEESVEYYHKAIELNSYDASCHHNLAWIYYSNGQLNKAANCIHKAINLNKDNPLYYVVNGLFAEESNKQLAISQYTKAVMLNPSICFSRFWKDLSLRHPQQAKKIVDNVINEIEPIAKTNPKIMAKLGILYYKSGKKTRAKYLLETAVERMPNLNRVWLYLYFLESDTDKKKIYLNRAIYLNPADNLPCYIKYHEKTYLKEKTYYESIKGRLYPYIRIEHDYMPSDIYGYVMTPCLND